MERNLGEQPIAQIMARLSLKAADLVQASEENITFKMVNKACKGRRLTPHVQEKVKNALNRAANRSFHLDELFTYSN